MKEKTTFVVIVAWVILAVVTLNMQIPQTVAMKVEAGEGIFRILFVFAPVNAILLTACMRGFWLKRDAIGELLKYPKVVMAMLLIDAACLLGVAVGFIVGAGAIQGSQTMLGYFLVSGVFVMLLNLPLLALYRDSLRVGESWPMAERAETS